MEYAKLNAKCAIAIAIRNAKFTASYYNTTYPSLCRDYIGTAIPKANS